MFGFQSDGGAVPRTRELPVGLADRVRPTTPVAGRLLPVPVPLAPLFPDRALRRGTTTTVAGPPGRGATTLALALLAAASQSGSWCAAVGLPDPGVVAAAELGIDLRRVVFVPHPGTGWAEAAGDLLSGVDVVLVRPPGRARPTAARHLSARARERQTALVVLVEHVSEWPEGGDLALSVESMEWTGVGRGHGHLQGRRAEVRVSGRRSAGRPVECSLWLPAGSGVVEATTEEDRPEGAGPGNGPEAA
ncbi:MAG TPA: hypothetical protein VG298_06840 [Acidimicrobiales bacterium]|nr:hypothetical protein [Acidimicrobiales bacterium]